MLGNISFVSLLLLVHNFPLHVCPRKRTSKHHHHCDNMMMADNKVDNVAKGAIEHLLSRTDKDDDKIRPKFLRGLLLEPAEMIDDQYHHAGISIHQNNASNMALHQQLRGLPKHPLYKEISRRLQIIQQYIGQSNDDYVEETLPCFLPASHFDLAETCPLNDLIPTQSLTYINVESCTRWLQNAGEDGVYAILGCRRTIGTIQLSTTSSSYLFPPTISQLLNSSRKLHKPQTKSSLTVAARALAKHCHRGTDQFFGMLKGNEAQKNEHANQIIQRLIDEALWMNIHCFGGVDESNPVIEIRTFEGYGARWSGIWDDIFSPRDVEFRGFLEPQMEDGHEKRWRH